MFFEEKKGVKAVRVALAVAACTTFAGAHAQSSTDQQPQQVLITGSNIKTLDVETASPVQVVTRADIQRQGATNIADLINNLAASTGSVLNDIGGSNSFAPGATNVSFRNLGEQSTLVLLNGRRLPSYALADFTSVFVNVDAIPLDAVERVEVLKVGASAIYGSDAPAIAELARSGPELAERLHPALPYTGAEVVWMRPKWGPSSCWPGGMTTVPFLPKPGQGLPLAASSAIRRRSAVLR